MCERYGTEGKKQNAVLHCGGEQGTKMEEREREREETLLAALSTREALGGGTLSHSTPDHRCQSPFLLSLSLLIQITGSVAFEGRERERGRDMVAMVVYEAG